MYEYILYIERNKILCCKNCFNSVSKPDQIDSIRNSIDDQDNAR